MKVSSETLKAEITELQGSLLATSREFSAVQREANTVEATVVDNVRYPIPCHCKPRVTTYSSLPDDISNSLLSFFWSTSQNPLDLSKVCQKLWQQVAITS